MRSLRRRWWYLTEDLKEWYHAHRNEVHDWIFPALWAAVAVAMLAVYATWPR